MKMRVRTQDLGLRKQVAFHEKEIASWVMRVSSEYDHAMTCREIALYSPSVAAKTMVAKGGASGKKSNSWNHCLLGSAKPISQQRKRLEAVPRTMSAK